jgi:hypothetical protein
MPKGDSQMPVNELAIAMILCMIDLACVTDKVKQIVKDGVNAINSSQKDAEVFCANHNLPLSVNDCELPYREVSDTITKYLSDLMRSNHVE